MKKYFYLLPVAIIASSLSLCAQISFLNANAKLGFANNFSGVAIAVADMNSDGYDDIVHLRNGRILTIQLQKPDGSGLQTINVGQISNQSQWSMCVADANNNGFNDILAGGSYDGVKLARASADGTNYTVGNLPGTNIFLQGSNFVDINNDGWIDIFACHDDGNNRIWINDGAGNFTPANDLIPMATVPPSDNSGNYGSVWSDVNNDGHLDLYIAKCRSGVNSPSDGRRINQLFLNNGDGTFTQDTTNFSGLRIGAQSWTADFGDFDNDGDMDCFITNHDAPSQLLINDGTGVFTDVTAASGINVQGLPVQGIFRDFDNDGFLDIIVAGTRHHLFRNNGNGTFTDVGNAAFGNVQMESFAVGDLNQDGRLDVYGGYAQVYTTPSNIPDVIWLNTSQNDNHYLTVRLEGTTSNRNAIGARISIFGPWGIQIREVRSGESYGIMNSFYQHFGLGQSTSVDSIVVAWPSGLREVFYDIQADQSIQIIEGECISPNTSVTVDGPLVFCPGESVDLSVSGGDEVTWSNGVEAREISATESGLYSAVVRSAGSECATITPAVEVVVDPPVFPVIVAQSDTTFCPGGSVVLQASQADSYSWSTGEETQSITVSESGAYTVSIPGLCRFFDSEPMNVFVLDAPAPVVANDTIFEPGLAVLTATGDFPAWYEVQTGGEPLFIGNTFEIPMLMATDTFYVEDPELYTGPISTVGPEQHAGPSQFSGNNTNGQLIFDAFQPFILRTVKVSTDTPGKRIIELRNAQGTVLQEHAQEFPNGETIVELNFEVPTGTNLVLSTNTAQNQMSLGFASPRFRRTTNVGISYPYVIPDVLSIKTTNLGSDVYYYFYNWVVKLPDIECISERVPVYAVLMEPNSTADLVAITQLSLAPNPAGDHTLLTIAPALTTPANLQVIDGQGRVISSTVLPAGAVNHNIDLSRLAPGVYHLRVVNGNGVAQRTLVVQR